jgi:hypothetical protein
MLKFKKEYHNQKIHIRLPKQYKTIVINTATEYTENNLINLFAIPECKHLFKDETINIIPEGFVLTKYNGVESLRPIEYVKTTEETIEYNKRIELEKELELEKKPITKSRVRKPKK